MRGARIETRISTVHNFLTNSRPARVRGARIETRSDDQQDEVDAELEHRLAAVPELANRVLRVIVSKDEPRRVITAHLDRKLKGKL